LPAGRGERIATMNLRLHTETSPRERLWWGGLLAAAVLLCVFQIVWFWRFHSHNITMDGINYIGLARHLVDGNLRASLHGYWSPLLTWVIATLHAFSNNYTLLGHVATTLGLLACLPLLYWLTWSLWRSRVAAALSVFWFVTARQLVAIAVGSILADFLLTSCVLLYSVLLLRALRSKRASAWIPVGAAHALAFLAKAIAMPWLAVSTLIAVVLANRRSPRRMMASLLLAALVPAAAWAGWGLALRTKYGVFTTGYQLRQNLTVNWHRELTHYPRGDPWAYADTSAEYDDYMVGEESWSKRQAFNLLNPALLGMIVRSEAQNIPQAVKETTILLGPGGVLAFAALLIIFIRRRELSAEAIFLLASLTAMVGAVLAYCMLVFDGRYVIPVAAVLICISCPILLPGSLYGGAPPVPDRLRRAAAGVFGAGVVFFALYWASPFRTQSRDFELSVYQAAEYLRCQRAAGTLVSLGNGPYPEHGVGFEVGPYVAYLSGWRLTGKNTELPDASGADELASKALAATSDAIAVWGTPPSSAYQRIVSDIQSSPDHPISRKILDPEKGEVGTLILKAGSRTGADPCRAK
jgi:4-amino-4-deoxy-L-arabinose transferase-like glycosyltransferase